MNWFLIALISPFLWALSVRIDKELIGKYFHGETGVLILFSSFISLLVLPFIFFVQPSVIIIDPFLAILVIIAGMISILYLFPYLMALNLEEASRVIPIFQTIPLFGSILAFFILGEVLTIQQMVAGLLIIFGAIGISTRITLNKFKLNKKVLLLMFLASILVAFSGVLFKFVTIETDFFTTLFWQQIGFFIIGLFIFVLNKDCQKKFLVVFKTNSKKIISLNIFNEVINIVALIIFNYATLLAPIGLVWVINGFQPVFILIIGVIITLFFPKFGKENIDKKSLLQKIFFIGVMLIGVAIIGINGA